MSSKLIKMLTVANGAILVLSLLLVVYLFFFEPISAAQWVSSHAQTELGAILNAPNMAEVKTRAESLYAIANSGMRSSVLLSAEICVLLLVIAVLSILSLVWLKKLKSLSDDTHDT